MLHQSGSLVVASSDFTLTSVFVLEIIIHSQPGNPPDAAQTHDGAVAAPATAKEASVTAFNSTHSVQREQTVHSIHKIFHLPRIGLIAAYILLICEKCFSKQSLLPQMTTATATA